MESARRFLTLSYRIVSFGIFIGMCAGGFAQEPSGAAAGPPEAEAEGDPGWPRVVEGDGLTLTIYQPQIETFTDSLLEARAAVAVESKDSKQPNYGVIWIKANANVDKERGLVDLTDIQITKAKFPGAPDRQDEFLKIIRDHAEASRTISLARIEANLAMTATDRARRTVPVKNDPPTIFYSAGPAILVLVDGEPVLRPVEGSPGFQRVINTRALIVFEASSNRFDLTATGRWFTAPKLDGPWSLDVRPPEGAEELRQRLASAQDGQVDLLEDPGEDVKKALDIGIPPAISVSTGPAELIVTQGKPRMQPIPETQLLWVQNTSNNILFSVPEQRYYVALSGRWYRAPSLSGPWEFVRSDKLPADFAKIPEQHPKGGVLATVAGTPQAKEAAIADTIPQTAQVKRSDVTIDPQYDGDPEWDDIPETPLAYAKNCPTPVIRVEASSYFAVEDGVWYSSVSWRGPWVAATVVPPVIYTIPITCPIYYVTYVRVYRWTDDFIWVGYTPGYLGTCRAPWGTIVYGTGWYYRPWIGRVWIGAPWTWGFGVSVGWDWTVGVSIAFGRPYWHPWWGPIGWGWGHRRAPLPSWRPGGRVAINRINVYNRVPGRVTAPRPVGPPGWTARPESVRRPGTPPGSGRQLARPDVYAGRDGNVYRPGAGGWEHNDGQGWRGLPSSPPPRERVTRPSIEDLSRERQAREAGRLRSEPRASPRPAPRRK